MQSITRRDFINGVALGIAAGLAPAAQIAAQPSRYPPLLRGLRGQHAGSFETAHAFARDRAAFSVADMPADERYDLVVVGGGISGLAAAWFYRRARKDARILILDNHDDFGGHAKRNEFMLDGRLVIGYGGSQSIDSPNSWWTDAGKGLLRDLGVDVKRFETAFERDLYSSLGLSRGMFFPREAFGRDHLAIGEALIQRGDASRRLANAKPLTEVVAGFPISEQSKTQILALYSAAPDPLAGRSAEEKLKLLKATSYRDFLIKVWGCNVEVANCFQGRTLGFFGLGCDAVPAADVRDQGYPGFRALNLPASGGSTGGEPYIYHFPDGNASLARLMVRGLVPGIAPGNTMDDIVLAPFDYARLDNADSTVRIRLDSTCIDVRNADGEIRVGYVRDGRLYRIAARHAVLACFHMMIPHVMPELSQPQREALAQNVKTPVVYTNVLVPNWRPWVELKVSEISAPMSFHSRVALDFPVSLGGYRHPRDPAEPMVLHLVHVAGAPNQGLTARQQFKVGQAKLLQMPFSEFEARIRDELDRMLGDGGFASDRDIAAITVNRWPHGYGYVENSLFDGEDYENTLVRARQTVGRVAIANSDAGGDAYAHLAIDQAARAVRELIG
ncbi:MAG: NAD(P)/FAD-dependent oxidoreductase [Xanthobacteraceae bacterium]|nr:NAD(P)/FAD-dependent oxidoreductase [Xanthobacteraceae bacterium]